METVRILEKPAAINWEYDAEADVLYLSIGEPRPAVGVSAAEFESGEYASFGIGECPVVEFDGATCLEIGLDFGTQEDVQLVTGRAAGQDLIDEPIRIVLAGIELQVGRAELLDSGAVEVAAEAIEELAGPGVGPPACAQQLADGEAVNQAAPAQGAQEKHRASPGHLTQCSHLQYLLQVIAQPER